MELVKQSRCFFLLSALWSLCCESALGGLMVRFFAWCETVWQGSALMRVLRREGTLPRSWPRSVTCRLLNGVVNLPAALLHRWYRAWEKTFQGSFFATLVYDMGDHAAVAVSWLMALLLSIPYERWNNAYSLLGFAFCLLLVIAGGMRRKTLRLDVTAMGPYAVAFAATVVLAVPLSSNPSTSMRFLFYHLACMLCVLVTVSAVRHTKDLVRLTAGAALGVLTSSCYGILQRIQGIEVNESYVDLSLNAGMPGRIYSFYDNPNAFAQMLIFFLPLVMALVLCSKRWLSKAAALGVFGLGGIALLMTYGRASWVGLAFAVLVFCFLWRPKLIPLLIVCGVACIPFLPASILNRILTITNFKDSSTSSRIPLYEAGFNLIGVSPISGAGLGTTTVQQFIRDNNLYHARAPFVHAHNIYLQVWLETGLFGLVSFVGTVLWGYKSAAAAVKTTSSQAAKLITMAGAAAIAGACVCGVADYLWGYPRVMCAFWFLFAIVLSGIKVCKLEQ